MCGLNVRSSAMYITCIVQEVDSAPDSERPKGCFNSRTIDVAARLTAGAWEGAYGGYHSICMVIGVTGDI